MTTQIVPFGYTIEKMRERGVSEEQIAETVNRLIAGLYQREDDWDDDEDYDD